VRSLGTKGKKAITSTRRLNDHDIQSKTKKGEREERKPGASRWTDAVQMGRPGVRGDKGGKKEKGSGEGGISHDGPLQKDQEKPWGSAGQQTGEKRKSQAT